MNLIEKIKARLTKLLGIDDLNNSLSGEIRQLRNQVDSNKSDIYYTSNKVSHNKASINTLHRTVESVVRIGTDIDYSTVNQSNSWAVICIEGNINIVKFVDLSNRDAREVLNFLKQFEAGKHCIDAPNRMYREEFFKF
ncbi:MAG TPA: hypothetical protein GX707_11150 [Epulopiscium sp.]|nr:hypothetical protein [Candidatus Epulonipiscium sp.]